MKQDNGQRRYIAFLVRLWQVDDVRHPTWRASIQDPHTGEGRGFADLKELFTFLEKHTDKADQLNARCQVYSRSGRRDRRLLSQVAERR